MDATEREFLPASCACGLSDCHAETAPGQVSTGLCRKVTIRVMKILVVRSLLLVTLCGVDQLCAQQSVPPSTEMTTYFVGLLYRGPNWTKEVTPEVLQLQEGHMANIRKMASGGKLILAGPFTDGGNLRGMFVFNVSSAAEAKGLTDADPAVKAGRLAVEIHPWLAPKGIQAGSGTSHEKK